jgi:hypothetical protein
MTREPHGSQWKKTSALTDQKRRGERGGDSQIADEVWGRQVFVPARESDLGELGGEWTGMGVGERCGREFMGIGWGEN